MTTALLQTLLTFAAVAAAVAYMARKLWLTLCEVLASDSATGDGTRHCGCECTPSHNTAGRRVSTPGAE